MRVPKLATGLCVALATAVPTNAQTPIDGAPELRVLTYDSFVSDWGPGPVVEAAFEATCGCDLVFESAGDGAAMLARLMLTGARTEADIVLGLDTNLTAAAAASLLLGLLVLVLCLSMPSTMAMAVLT